MEIKDIINLLPKNYILEGKSRNFDNYLSIFEANEKSLVWLNPKRSDKQEILNQTKAKLIITDGDIDKSNHSDKTFIIVDNPKLTFLRIINFLIKQSVTRKISSSAKISLDATIGKNCSIGENVLIGNCKIGDNVTIEHNAVIYDNTIIGDNTIIKANSTIGGEGYGYSKNEDNEWELFPHIGGVEIGKNVHIGSNTCIDRGGLGNTIIKDGVKIDNLVHIAHNVEIGENSMIIAKSMIGGSVKIGSNSWIAPSVSILDTLSIGNNVMIGMGAVVTKNIPDNQLWVGVPAKYLKDN